MDVDYASSRSVSPEKPAIAPIAKPTPAWTRQNLNATQSRHGMPIPRKLLKPTPKRAIVIRYATPERHAKSARRTNTNKPKQMTTRHLNSKEPAAEPPYDQGRRCQTRGRTPRRTDAKTESDNVKGAARGRLPGALRRRYARAQPRIPNPPSGKAAPHAGRSIVELQAGPAWKVTMRQRRTIRSHHPDAAGQMDGRPSRQQPPCAPQEAERGAAGKRLESMDWPVISQSQDRSI